MEQLPPRVLDMLPRALVAGSGNRDMSLGIIQAIQSIDALLFAVEGDKRRLMDAVRARNVCGVCGSGDVWGCLLMVCVMNGVC